MTCGRKIGPFDCCSVVRGDCLELMAQLSDKCVDVVITDPPYGISENSGRRLHAYRNPEKSKGRIGGSRLAAVREYGDTTWDNKPMSTAEWAEIQRVSEHQIAWGSNHLLEVIGKPNSILAWDKKRKNNWKDMFSDCEFAACSLVGPDRMFRHLWMGALREGRPVERKHPMQKPEELMEWCIGFFPEAQIILDPYMGSGTTLVAAKRLGKHFLGFDISREYCSTAQSRLDSIMEPVNA